MIAILFSLIFILLWYKYKKNNGNCVGTWLLLWYAITSILTVLEFYINPINSSYLDQASTIYYVVCQIIALYPFLLIAKYDCRKFQFCEELFLYLAYVLIPFGLYNLIQACVDLYGNINMLFGNISAIRQSFYSSFLESHEASPFQKLNIIVRRFNYMSPFLAFYFLCRNKKKIALWLLVASIASPLGQITKGEREGSLKYIVNIYFCYLFFKPALSEVVVKKVKTIGIGILVPFVIFIVAMTFSRFGGTGLSGVLDSLFLYGGDQPFFFTTIFNDSNILDQIQGGRVNFQYFFPVRERVQGQINLYIDSELYLNQFCGMPGSLFLDFGYNTIYVILFCSMIYVCLIYASKKERGRYPVHILFLLYLSFQVLYMNIFYYDFCDLFSILFSFVFFVICGFYSAKKDSFES